VDTVLFHYGVHSMRFIEDIYYPLTRFAYTAKNLAYAVTQCLSNPSLIVPFFWGPIHSQIPHVRAYNPLGHLDFTYQNSQDLTTAALNTTNGIATLWAGPFPIHYVTSNAARHALVRESHMGVINETSSEFLHWMTGGNSVMASFPDFQPINSIPYKIQRDFLLKRFHGGAKQRLPDIEKSTTQFLQDFYQNQEQQPLPLRDFINALILNNSANLLGLKKYTLDKIYLERESYRVAIDRVAKYGISEKADPALEEDLYQVFLRVLETNFSQISSDSAENNLIRNIFTSLEIDFPTTFEDFHKLPKDLRYKIAMTFSSTGLGAMVHSTATTLDWAVARLLQDPKKKTELVQLMAQYKTIDLTEDGVFDKSGPLFPLCEWVLHNVFLYPTFSHEFFYNQTAYSAALEDGSTIEVPGNSIVVVNYVQCNRSESELAAFETFSKTLEDSATTGRFIMDKRVASFGGSKTSKENEKSRICPGAKTSLYEQMIILAILLRDYSLELIDSQDLSCDVDPAMHPLCVRANSGTVVLSKINPKSTLTSNRNAFFNEVSNTTPPILDNPTPPKYTVHPQ